MARKQTPTTEIDNQEVAPEVAQAAADIQNTSASIISAGVSEQEQVAKLINMRAGRRQMAEMIKKLVTVADLVDLQNLKDSKGYKNFNAHIDGKLVTITNWEEYCTIVEGRSRESIDLDLKNLNALGPELFESMRTVGLGPSTMRAIRHLPDDQMELIQQAVSTTDKEDLAEFVEQLIAKNVKEKAALTKKVESLSQDIVAKDEVAKSNSERITELQEKAVLLTKMPLPERTKVLRTEIAQLTAGIDNDLRTNLWNALENFNALEGDDHVEFCKLQITELQSALDLLKQQFASGVEWE